RWVPPSRAPGPGPASFRRGPFGPADGQPVHTGGRPPRPGPRPDARRWDEPPPTSGGAPVTGYRAGYGGDPTRPAPAPGRPAPAGAPARRGRAERASALALAPLAVLAVSAWSWWSAVHLDGPGALLTAAGQITGLAAAVFALATVALMARVPVVTQVVGVDRAIRWHRWSATVTMVFLPVHVVATTLGYAAGGSRGFAGQFASFVTSLPDMATATVAAALFVAVSTTSVRAIRRRFRYQTWLFIHWY